MDLPEVPSATENGAAQVHYCLSQQRTFVEEDGEKAGGLGTCLEKNFPKLRPLECRKTPFLGTQDESCYHH